MLAELGLFTLILAFLVALALGLVPLIGAGLSTNEHRLKPYSLPAMQMTRPTALLLFALLTVSVVCLAISFYSYDFSVAYVGNHSNVQLPLLYRISAVWGSHEGSMLFWCWVLAGWIAAVAIFSNNLPDPMRARVLAILGLVAVGFIAFTLFTSSPFERAFLQSANFTGNDLNPILQHPGQALHPPLLYFGYVGFAVPFAFAMAALLGGRLDALWVRWTRPWAIMAWLFLTVGITLGSWWAYHELGWGGWWFWDPVENASFMPWLTGTALIHSLAATEKRGVFKSWTVLLAIICFAFSILGTLLVRSGLIESVHAFASDPGRGTYLLIFFIVVVVGALTVFAARAQTVANDGAYAGWSRELMLLANNVLLTMLAIMVVLTGTLAPMVAELFGYSLSVGPRFFDKAFLVIGIPLLMIMGVGTLTRWKRDNLSNLLPRMSVGIPAVIFGCAAPLWLFGSFSMMSTVGAALAFWVILTACVDPFKRLRKGRKIPAHIAGMSLAHMGMGIFVLGVTAVHGYSLEKESFACLDETVEVGGYEFTLVDKIHYGQDAASDLALDDEGKKTLQAWLRHTGESGGLASLQKNYISSTAQIEIRQNGELLGMVYPEQRLYVASGQPTKESAVHVSVWRDLYTAVEIDRNGFWRVNIHIRPLMRWVWLGALLMALGGLLAALDRRYRIANKEVQQAQHDLATLATQKSTANQTNASATESAS